MTTVTWNPIASLTLIAAILVVLCVIFSMRPDFRNVTARRRRTLILIRFGIVLMLGLAMVRPGCRRTIEEPQTATVAFFCDVSRSMRLPHESGGESRWSRMQVALAENQDRLARLSKRLDLRFYSLSGHALPLEFADGRVVLPGEPDAGQTDLGTSLHEGIARHQSQRIAAVFLLTDGRQNADDPEYEISQSVQELDQLQVPLYPISFGQASDAGQSADVAVVGLADQFSIFVKNELAVKATVRLTGFANQEVPVRLRVTDPDGQSSIVDTQVVQVAQADQTLPVTLNYSPQQAGQYLLSVEAAEQPSELVTQNNRLPAFLTVHEGGLRVLYLEGYLRLEQKFLRRSLAASQDIELDFQFINPVNRDRWPLDLASTLSDPKYDVFIIGDLDSRALYDGRPADQSLPALLESVTERGKGLLLLGGYHAYGPGRYHDTPLAEIFPVQMQRYEAQDFDSDINHDLHIERPLQMRPTMPHFVTNLVPGAANESAWESLPPLLGANRFLGIKDRSLVLAESQYGDPLLVAGTYGGRVLAFAGDSTWQWWTHGDQELHKRFWRQAILWLAKLDGITNDNVWIDLAQRRFNPGSEIVFSAGAKKASGEPILDADLAAELVAPNGERVRLGLFPNENGASGTISSELTSQAGTYAIEASATKSGQALGSTRVEFIVFDEDREQAEPAADPNLLANMANQTQNWGGKLLTPNELSEQLDQLESLPLELKIEVPHKWELGDSLGDAAAFLAVFVAMIAGEWILRKKWGMV